VRTTKRLVAWRSILLPLLALFALLAGGAAVNVAVAWGFAWLADPQWDVENSGLTFAEQPGYSAWMTHHATAPGLDHVMTEIFADGVTELLILPIERRAEAVVPPWARGRHIVPFAVDPAEGEWMSCADEAAGWPLLALASSMRARARDNKGEQWKGAIAVPDWGNPGPSSVYQGSKQPRHLPYLPLWPGFALNTLFYASLLGLLFLGPGRLRRYLRGRRGLCPACAYPVGEGPVCTECGRPAKENQN
jgi:hypothetical protein